MNLLVDAFRWIFGGSIPGTDPIPEAYATHLAYTFISVFAAAVIAIPIGWWIGHTGRGRDVAVTVAGAARAIPSFGLFVLLILIFGVLHQPEAAVVTFVILAIPSILAGAYSGFEAIDRQIVDAGRAMGMTEWQIVWKIEVPLGLPLLVAGLRSAVLQVVATVTIAAYVDIGGLGQYILAGLPLRRPDVVLGGAILVAALALVLDAIFAILQRLAVPRGLSGRPTRPSGAEAVGRQLTRRTRTTSAGLGA
ncbi:ABC transporter permease [Microbacterium sp.]|uniref:ABC transporter permease n=1 Tax=Microbacterium sp. TaxID=51671 RepID=UPI00092C2C00|nr:ABC transporter permease [Microbacterium sp.]OJU70286.1 MAG: glycine/betaine ABC transporter permease [Microbacterium sp. 70-38]MBN9179280.1 ABC transporter permease [Microbacterium sp.]MBN9186405.1 ABC transporter permease [Microbacterium sp.]MBN9188021.1 ABC transporter permease [Microbacterium sp.]MBN9191887.1 ABC transporter permease [Microbacterium sp.]